jgi:hypothetical protein
MGDEYKDRVKRELELYEGMESIHELPPSQHYLNETHLRKLLNETFPYGTFEEMVAHYYERLFERLGRPLEMLSVGAGNCDFEIHLLSRCGLQAHITCLELNPAMLDRAAAAAREEGVMRQLRLTRCDVNELMLPRRYDLIIANYALHHFVELERIFAQLKQALHEHSFLLVNDMIGRNGHLFWEPTLDICNRLWMLLPKDKKYNHQLLRWARVRKQFDCSQEGFEGIRAQDILPLLDNEFVFRDFAPFYAIVNRFTDRDFGPNFDPDLPLDRALLDYIWQLDLYCCRNRLLRPTQMLACLQKTHLPEEERRWLFFERPADLYRLEDRALLRHFDEANKSGRRSSYPAGRSRRRRPISRYSRQTGVPLRRGGR